MTAGELARRVKYLFQRDRFAEELREEMRLHIELRARKLTDRGLDAAAAGYAARRQFGNRGQYELGSSEVWGWMMLERILQDIRMGLRSLRKTPGFTVTAILTLAVGLGMNTAVYSVVNSVMLRQLPYAQPEQLVSLWEEHPPQTDSAFSSHGSGFGGKNAARLQRTTVSIANLPDYADSAAFQGMASFDVVAMNLTGTGVPERVPGEKVSWSYFGVLGVKPAQGRDFTAADDNPQAEPAVILTHGFWQRRLGGDTQILGQTVALDGRKYRVIGILPRGFQSPNELNGSAASGFFVPAAYTRKELQERGDHDVAVIARLKPGVSLQAAQSDLNVIHARLARQYPATNKDMYPTIFGLREDLVAESRTALWSLLGASGLLVLITCVNVASLLLVRATGRGRELSVRLAMGASRVRLVRLFLTESLLLSAGGCAAGVGMGVVIMRALLAAAPRTIPRLNTTSMDWTVFAVAAGIATLTGLAFGLVPAWHAARMKPADALRTSARSSAGKGQVRSLSFLTMAEVALSLMLLVGAGLLLRSFAVVMGVDLGFQPDRVLAMNINLTDQRYKTADLRLQFFQALESRVRALPGVQRVAYANRMPMRGGWRSGFTLEGQASEHTADFQAVNPGYFETLGVSLVRGRLLTPYDRKGQPPVAVVNREFGKVFLNGADPLGHVFVYTRDARVTIVGVVNDIRRGGKEASVLPEVYLAAAQTELYPTRIADFAVRTAGDPAAITNAVRHQVLSLDKDQPITNVRTLHEVIDLMVAERRFQMLLLTVFATVAIVLAVVGIYGVLSYSMAQRTGELGIRVALGAHPLGIVAMVMRQAGQLVGAGLILGLAGALLLTRYLASLLFEVPSTDWLTYAAAIVALGAAALVAALVPAMRSARVDPLTALRNE